VKVLLLLPLILAVFPFQNPPAPDSSVLVVGFKCEKSRQTVKPPDTSRAVPAREMIPQNKLYARNARINDPMGAKDPNEDTIDGRSAAIEKNVQAARTPRVKDVDGFAYRARVQNASAKVVEILFLEFQFIDPLNPTSMTRRQFLCGVNIKPEKQVELHAFSILGPTDVISAGSLANGSGDVFQEKVVINRVEYADGTIWQRKAWNFGEIRMTYQRAVASPWDAGEMCRVL